MHLHIISRKISKKIGMKTFFTGIPCIRGHVSLRYNNGACIECSRSADVKEKYAIYRLENREKRNKCSADYRNKNKNKIAECKKKHYANNREEVLAKCKEYRNLNKDKKAKSDKEYREINIEKIRQYAKIYYEKNKDKLREAAKNRYERNKDRYVESINKWREKNQEIVKESKKRWAEKNKDSVKAVQRNRRARKRMSNGRHTKDDVISMLERQKYKCASCRCDISKYYEVDHVMPLALGGTNFSDNLQCLCMRCNRKKGAKHPIDWAQENGRLL